MATVALFAAAGMGVLMLVCLGFVDEISRRNAVLEQRVEDLKMKLDKDIAELQVDYVALLRESRAREAGYRRMKEQFRTWNEMTGLRAPKELQEGA